MKIDEMRDSSPIIIVGAARSGTKFVRGLLASTPGFACVPYDVNYIWRLGNDSVLHDELKLGMLSPKIRDSIVKSLFKIAKINSADITLVEKSVSSGLRIDFIDAVFPNARYIHLIRDGRAVVESSMRMWNAPPQKSDLLKKLKSLPLNRYSYVFWFAKNYIEGKVRGRGGGAVWGPRYDGIFADIDTEDLLHVVTKQWKTTVDLAERSFEKIDAARVLTIRYDDLMEHTSEITRIADFIGIRDSSKLEQEYMSSVQPSNAQKWRVHLSQTDLKRIEEIAGDTLVRHGYVG